jgi:hypothetical protein
MRNNRFRVRRWAGLSLTAPLLAACCDHSAPIELPVAAALGTNCIEVAEAVALHATEPKALSALKIFSDDKEKAQAREEAVSMLEQDQRLFDDAGHDDRMVLGITQSNRYAESYLDAYARCRSIELGES